MIRNVRRNPVKEKKPEGEGCQGPEGYGRKSYDIYFLLKHYRGGIKELVRHL